MPPPPLLYTLRLGLMIRLGALYIFIYITLHNARKKLGRVFGKNIVEWTGRVEFRREKYFVVGDLTTYRL